MGKINYVLPVESMSGKWAQKSDVMRSSSDVAQVISNVKIWKSNGSATRYTRILRNPFVGEASSSQTAQRAKFKQAWASVATVLADPAQLAQYKEAFEKQKKYKSLRNYIFVKEYEKL